MMDNASMMAALQGPTPTGLSPVTPRRNNAAVKTNSRIKQSAPGTKLAPNLTNARAPAHADRTRAKKVGQPGVATRATQTGY